MPSKSPDAFRTISEVADWLNTPAHVLRFWESKFSQVKPVKRAGGRRYYRPADMVLIGGIKKLLHDDGMTIKGVQKILREQGIKHVSALSPPLEEDLEAMIEPPVVAAAPPPPVAPVAPVQETGQVLDFAGRANTVESTAAPESPAPEGGAETVDLFAGDDGDHDNIFGSDDPAAMTGDATESPDSADGEALPDFVQKPLSDRMAEDDGEAPRPAEPRDNPPPVDVNAAPEPAPETREPRAPEPLAGALPDPAPEASADQSGSAPEARKATPDSDEDEDARTPMDPAILAAVLRASDDDDDEEDAPRVLPVETPPDPGDHDVIAAPGLLTLLTAPRTRDLGLSAEQIETLIVRVRSHARAMSHAARN
ncbi:MerR family transcriptional regulator [Marinovum sp.]|uniref:MerR family transcriptional regulator n=1 Tax=Marinovum sp. TaxID=2024839 RepID=UPI002B271C54|nr:MerR family transcriptional regulator [Marinovum sp.]